MLFIPNKASEKQLKFWKCLQAGGNNVWVFSFPQILKDFQQGIKEKFHLLQYSLAFLGLTLLRKVEEEPVLCQNRFWKLAWVPALWEFLSLQNSSPGTGAHEHLGEVSGEDFAVCENQLTQTWAPTDPLFLLPGVGDWKYSVLRVKICLEGERGGSLFKPTAEAQWLSSFSAKIMYCIYCHWCDFERNLKESSSKPQNTHHVASAFGFTG